MKYDAFFVFLPLTKRDLCDIITVYNCFVLGEIMAQSCDRAVFEDGELAVILGDGVTARLCALCLHALCGTVAVICDVRRSRARFVLPFGNFLKIQGKEFLHYDKNRASREKLRL